MRPAAGLVVLIALLSLHCRRGVSYDLRDPDLAVEIEGEVISRKAFELLVTPYVLSGALTREEFLQKLIHNRLVHRHRQQRGMKEAALSEELRIRAREQVASLAAMLIGSDQLAAIIDASIVRWNIPSPSQSEALYAPRPDRHLAVDKLLDQEKARAHMLLEYRLPTDAAPRHLSYEEVYTRARSVVREELQKGNAAALREQARTVLRDLYIEELAADPAGEHYQALGDIRRIVEDEYAAKTDELERGFRRHEHDSGGLAAERAKRIPLARIRAYYEANRDEFREVAEVRCRHIRFDDHRAAEDAYRELQAGADFAAMVTKYSVAPDRANPDPGLLPVVKNVSPAAAPVPLLHTLCLMQPERQVSVPSRTPDGLEIVYVEERREGYQSLDQETVRWSIARRLAAHDLVAERDTELAVLVARARIRVNPLALVGEAK